MAIRFDDRTAIVTGAGSGLGRAHALMLASRGARVIVNDPGKSAGGEWLADTVVAEIVAAGGQAAANHESVASVEGAQRLVEQAVDAFGVLDILINNAGYFYGPVENLDSLNFEQETVRIPVLVT